MRAVCVALLGVLAVGVVSEEPLSVMYTLKGGDKSSFEDNWEFEVLPHWEDDPEEVYRVIGLPSHEKWLTGKAGVNVTEVRYGKPFKDINPPDGYNTPEELFEQMRDLETNYPDIADVFSVNAKYQTPPTHGGRHIFAIKISDNVKEDEDEPNFLVASAHHCRELITPQIAAYQAQFLVEQYGIDPVATRLVDENEIFIIWSMNPDGAHFVWNVDDMWRKNRRDNFDGTMGVDLNRNYPVGWELPCSGSPVSGSNNYRGPFPMSEAEINAMLALHRDRHFMKVLDWHSSGRDVRQIYGTCAELPQILDDYFGVIDAEMAATMDYAQRRSCCLAGNIHVAYHDQGALSFLSETGPSFQPPADVMREEVLRVLPGFSYLMTLPTSIFGHVYDLQTGAPLASVFTLPQLDYELDETAAYTRLPFARYHLWVPDGQWVFQIDVEGRETYTEVVTVTQGTERNFYIP